MSVRLALCTFLNFLAVFYKTAIFMKYISFDLQGTLTDLAFCENFWFEELPKIYAKNKNLDIDFAKKELENMADTIGKSDPRFYDVKYWLDVVGYGGDVSEIFDKCDIQPDHTNMMDFVRELHGKVSMIIISSASHKFIKKELGQNIKYFDRVFSAVDDFGYGGKTLEVYRKIADILNVAPKEILHIGDNYEDDYINASNAGFNAYYLDINSPMAEHIKNIKTIL